MKTLIFDIDGTLTDMAPLEAAAYATLSIPRQRNAYRRAFAKLAAQNKLPTPQAYKSVQFIKENATNFRFVYATGGLKIEAEHVLRTLDIAKYFDLTNSIAADTYRFSKSTGLPFRRLARIYPDCLVITDSLVDVAGATKAGVPAILLKPDEELLIFR